MITQAGLAIKTLENYIWLGRAYDVFDMGADPCLCGQSQDTMRRQPGLGNLAPQCYPRGRNTTVRATGGSGCRVERQKPKPRPWGQTQADHACAPRSINIKHKIACVGVCCGWKQAQGVSPKN